MADVYEPAEDSQLLKKNIAKYAKSKDCKIVLDLGTGSGIQAVESSKFAEKVIAVDINPKAIKYCKKVNPEKNIEWIESDLFENITEQKFDLITFNPPYLPQDPGIDDPALYGGKKGWEIYERFFEQVIPYMHNNTKILILFSSLTNKTKIEELITDRCLEFKEIDKMSIFLELLFVYEIKKSDLLLELEDQNITDVSYLAHGKRGIVYTGTYEKKGQKQKVAIKTKNPDSLAIGRIEHEANMLERLNKYDIGPEYVMSKDNYLVYVYVEGQYLPEFLENEENKEKINMVLKKIFQQVTKMDELGINKEEMHRPLKHVLVNKNLNTKMIDFERCRFTEKPHNLTQFSKFLISGNVLPLLRKKGFDYEEEKIIELCQKYREGKATAEEIQNEIIQ